jgi:F-type H+-transporting ATPase subunit delta
MAELATIARPYADALFKASGAQLQATSLWLDEIAALASDPQLLHFASNPKATRAQIEGLLSVSAQAPNKALAGNFLLEVIDNSRLNALPEIAAQFRKHMNAQSGASDAVLYSAFAVDPQVLDGVRQTLEKRFGRKLHISVQIQEDLIGGVRIAVGDEVLDTSVKARLEQMKVALAA